MKRLAAVLAELCLVLSLILGGFCGWKFLVQPEVLGTEQERAAIEVTKELAGRTVEPPRYDGTVPLRDPEGRYGAIVIPALKLVRPLIQGTDEEALWSNVGHYASTPAPGAVGNVVLAGHRTGFGSPFEHLPELAPGDLIYLETIDGWYTYEYRNGAYTTPQDRSILAPVPFVASGTPSARLLTLQTCNPPHTGGRELFVGVAQLVSFTPRADGPPADVATTKEQA